MQTVLPDTFDSFESDAPAPPAAEVPAISPAVEAPPEAAEPVPQSAATDTNAEAVQIEQPEPVEQPADTREPNADGTFKAAPAEKPKVKAAKPRIDQLTWEREEARRDAAAARDEAARYRAELEAARRPAPQPVPTDPEPNPADAVKYPEGQYDRAFIKDQARWEARQEFTQQQQQAQQRAQFNQRQQIIAQRVGAFTQRIDAVKATDADVLSRVSPEILNLKPSHALAQGERVTAYSALADALLESDVPTQVMLHLTEHPEEYRRLLTLHPVQLFREMGKLEARLDPALTGSGSRPSVSQAKPPIKPVGSAPSATDEVDLSQDADLDTHVRVMNAREKRPIPRRY